MSGQSRWMSFMEAASGNVVGFALAVAANFFILPLFGFVTTLDQAFGITTVFTVLSIGRSYIWRRIFNWIEGRKA